jgi:hypothetical protein
MGTVMLTTGITCLADSVYSFTTLKNNQQGLGQLVLTAVLMYVASGFVNGDAARAYSVL